MGLHNIDGQLGFFTQQVVPSGFVAEVGHNGPTFGDDFVSFFDVRQVGEGGQFGNRRFVLLEPVVRVRVDDLVHVKVQVSHQGTHGLSQPPDTPVGEFIAVCFACHLLIMQLGYG